MKRVHVFASLIAIFLLFSALATGVFYARSLEEQYVHALAPLIFPQKSLGSALQRAALRQPDLLLLFGSSELRMGGRYQASELFGDYPTGFNVFLVGQHAATSLIFLQMLAADAPELRGKKVAISLTPGFFFVRMMDEPGYAFNFSRLNAGELAFSTDLDMSVKEGAAKRMLQYPTTVGKDPLLKFALEKLADGAQLSLFQYYAVLPLGKIQNFVLELQDHWETLNYLSSLSNLNLVTTSQPTDLDWPALLARAQQDYEPNADNNPFGMANNLWDKSGAEWSNRQNTLTDKEFHTKLTRAQEWTDLELLLRVLKQLGAQPLILSQPIHGLYYDYLGVTARARDEYYTRLEQLAAKYEVPVVDFHDYENDKYFSTDMSGHMSGKGWTLYDQALDAFYHGQPVHQNAPQ